jgi:DNA-binding beta-propeller fold protein YncE
MAVGPDGKSAYVVNTGGRTVSQYDVDPSSGALTPKTPATVPTSRGFYGEVGPHAIAVTPDGKHAYVTDQDKYGDYVLRNTIDPLTGALAPIDRPPTSEPGGYAIAITPDGKSAYVLSAGSVVYMLDIDPVSGNLSAKNPYTLSTQALSTGGFTSVHGIALTPDGRSAYITATCYPDPNPCPSFVAMYDVNPVSGVLTPKTPATVAMPGPFYVAVTPDGKSAYVTDTTGAIDQFDVDRASGQLSPKTPASVAVGGTGNAWAIGVGPDGLSAYTTDTSNNTVRQYDIDPPSGRLSPKTPASVATDSVPRHLAVGPLPRVPTNKEQCKHGGWHNFPQFKNQGQCVAFVEHSK